MPFIFSDNSIFIVFNSTLIQRKLSHLTKNTHDKSVVSDDDNNCVDYGGNSDGSEEDNFERENSDGSEEDDFEGSDDPDFAWKVWEERADHDSDADDEDLPSDNQNTVR